MLNCLFLYDTVSTCMTSWLRTAKTHGDILCRCIRVLLHLDYIYNVFTLLFQIKPGVSFFLKVSYTFCKELITVLLRNMKSEEIWPASSLVEALDKVSTTSNIHSFLFFSSNVLKSNRISILLKLKTKCM